MRMLIIFLLLNFMYFWLRMPVLAFGFTDWSLLCLAWGLLLWVISSKALLGRLKELAQTNKLVAILLQFLAPIFPSDDNIVNITVNKKWRNFKKLAIIGAVLIVIGLANTFVLPFLTTTPLFYSHAYRNLLGEVTESSFTADVAPIASSQIRIIDIETANKLAEKKIGEVPALGSETQLGEMVLQKVKDKLYYVAPLEHRGLFQWITNRSGSKGFVMVSATNPQDVKLIQNVDGKEVRLKYQTKGFIMDFLPRYLYFHGIVNVGMTDFSFEVDDDLHPYWVVSLYRNTIGFSGAEAVGVAVVDAQTGEIKKYSQQDAPAWIDRMQPEWIVYRQIQGWGEYINGFWNSILAKTGTLRPAGNQLHLIYGNDDKVYWYTGITSSGKDESTVGFVLVDSRTKEAKWYKVAGATEDGAKKSAEGQVQEKGYRAGDPILYNIYSVPTYITSLKDKEGLLKAVAFISVENYNIVGVGSDVESALRVYRQNLTSQGNLFVPGSEIKDVKIKGKVTRISQAVKGGESFFYFTLEGDKRIFIGTIQISSKLALTQVGDIVEVGFSESNDTVVAIREFQIAF